MVAGEADPLRSPLRRLVGAAFGSIMVGVIALAAVGLFGLVTGRTGAGWRDGGSVILERESGAAYVLRDGVLVPTANFTSALLLQQSPSTVTVPRKQLAGQPRAPMVGIPNAPESLPDPTRLLTGPWSLCTAGARTASGGQSATTALFVGTAAPGGRVLSDQEALLVKLPGGDTLYLVWHGYRYRINSADVVLEALALTQQPQVAVGGSWLNALPEGTAIAPLTQDGRGEPFRALPDMPDARVGQILVVETADKKQYYLVGRERLRPITPVEAAVALADPQTRRAYSNNAPQARELAAGAALAAPRAEAPAASAERPPDTPPRIARLSGTEATMCATFAGNESVARVFVDAEPFTGQGVPTERRTQRGASLVDRVVVAPGHGAVVAAQSSPSAQLGTLFLVTDLGVRYPLSSPDVLRMLGYPDAEPVRLPAGLVARLPEGPELDPEAAAEPVQPID
ncbi:hypothetical protein GCM10009681_10250 [Luedemannella helvata]|uniref:Type VII secretion protein EccB n=2 Tax=Luedemannella helvata TaxID=349315 RepID=A0ABP4W0M3_9ACTN